ncbi:MAG: hypothetical protein AAGB46_17165 [Verrucomicrobiota bacterium]
MKSVRSFVTAVFLVSSILTPLAYASHYYGEETMAILYSQKNFKGESYVLKPGEDIESFNDLGDGRWRHMDDEISSIEIVGNLAIEVFSRKSFRGQALEISESIPDLAMIGIAAISNPESIEEHAEIRLGNNWNNEISSVKAMGMAPEPRVVVFDRAGLSGDSFELGAEDSIANLSRQSRGWTSWNDAISSLEIIGPIIVRLYEHPQFRGRFIDVQGEIPDLQELKFANSIFDWDNRVSSIKVIPDESLTRPPLPPRNRHDNPVAIEEPVVFEDPMHDRPPAVLFYEDSNMNGEAISLFANEEIRNLNEFELNYKDWNDEISSLEIRDNVEVFLYEHAHFQGKRIQLKDSARSLSSIRDANGRYENWNDKTSSIRVLIRHGETEVTVTPAPPDPPVAGPQVPPDFKKPESDPKTAEEPSTIVAIIYEDSFFKGKSFPIENRAELPNLKDIRRSSRDWNDAISSIKVEGDIIIELYTDINFKGERIQINASQSSMNRVKTLRNRTLRLNDVISSLRVVEK